MSAPLPRERPEIPAAQAAALDALYAERPLASHAQVAALLQLSTVTLRRHGDSGRITYRLKGTSWRSYAREDVEAFIRGEPGYSPKTRRKPSRPARKPVGNAAEYDRIMEQVYFIRCGNTVKIGRAESVQRRLRKMATGNPEPLELLGTCDGGARLEAALHIRFAEHRTRGEWFRLVPDIEAYIREHCE